MSSRLPSNRLFTGLDRLNNSDLRFWIREARDQCPVESCLYYDEFVELGLCIKPWETDLLAAYEEPQFVYLNDLDPLGEQESVAPEPDVLNEILRIMGMV